MKTETFERPITQKVEIHGNIHEIMGSSAKSEKGYIQGRINHFRKFPGVKFTGSEIAMMFESMLGIHNKFHGEEVKQVENLKLEIEIVGKTKGIGTVEIYRGFDNNVTIRVPIKDKDTGVVKWMTKELKKEDLNRMIHIVKNLPLNESVSCYEIANKLGYDWKIIWKERTKIYFPIYYFPLKFLEATKNIKYGGRGDVIRLI